ncbi:MAG TPA: hypothetical protein VIL97_00800 [Thermoanaerobaculia bacterium]
MATAQQAQDAIAAKLEATLPSGTTPTRMATDLSTDLQPVPAGKTRYQLKAWAGPRSEVGDSNLIYRPVLDILMRVHYHLGAGEAERTWTSGSMHSALEAILDPGWWLTISEVFYLDSFPGLEETDVSRVGRVITFQLRARVTVDPNA